jgi:hypothetical protein
MFKTVIMPMVISFSLLERTTLVMVVLTKKFNAPMGRRKADMKMSKNLLALAATVILLLVGAALKPQITTVVE